MLLIWSQILNISAAKACENVEENVDTEANDNSDMDTNLVCTELESDVTNLTSKDSGNVDLNMEVWDEPGNETVPDSKVITGENGAQFTGMY